MKKLLLFLAFIIGILPAYSQSWTGILVANRANDWTQAGLPSTFPDGETTPNPWTPPIRTQCGATLQPLGSGQDDSPNISGALAHTLAGYTSCVPPYTIVLGGSAANPFTLASNLLVTTNNVTLRGSGPMTTIIQVTGGGIQLGTAFTSSGQTLLTANPAKGATSITTSAAPPTGLAWLTQCDTNTVASGAGFVNDSVNCSGSKADNGGIFVCHLNATCSAQTATVNNAHDQMQHVYVNSVTGTGPFTVNFTPPIQMPNWSTGNTVALGWDNTANHRVVGAGVENLTVQFINGSNATMGFRNSYGSWFKGLRIFGVGNNNHGLIDIVGSGNTLIANNYIYENDAVHNWVSGYALAFAFGSDDFNQGDSNSLLINNSIDGAAMEGLGGTSAGTIWAYSYMQNGLGWYPENGDFYHHGGSSFLLREGNEQFGAEDDDTDGTHNLNTYFRNHYALGDNPYTTWSIGLNYRGINIDSFARFENAIGNVIGSNYVSQQVTVNYIGSRYIFEFNSRGVETNGLTQASSMRWGNYNICTGNASHCNVTGGVWDSTEVPTSTVMPSGTYPNAAPYQNFLPANHTLPCSFFMKGFTSTSCNGGNLYPTGGTTLSWWKVCDTWSSTNLATANCTHFTTPPFPPNGPELPTIAPGGLSDANGYAYDIPAKIATDNLPIDTAQQRNYTVTGSSWSGGIETLTVTGLPGSSDHIMGQFQLTGVAAACNAATSEPWAEYKMSGSTTTTISYLLPVNPGTTCNGTVKWPDIRQFDEKVFTIDAAAAGVPTLVQHASCPNGRNVGGASSPTPDYICPLPEPSQAGNAILVGITTTTGATFTLSSTKFDGTADGNTWSLVDSATDSGNSTLISIYLATNVAAGTRFIKFHRTGDTQGVAMSASEYYNVATSSAVDAHACTIGASSTSISSGNIIPVTSGDLIWQWALSSGNGVPNSNTSFTVGSQPNITWQFLGTDLYDGDAVQAGVQTVAGAINPTFTAGTAHPFDSCSMALKAATAGNAPTNPFRIVHMLHQQFPKVGANPWKVQFATSGNLIVESLISGGSFVTSASSVPVNTWTSTGANAGGLTHSAGSQIYYAANATPSNSMVINFTRDNNTSDGTLMLYDFVGAATAPFDKDSGGQNIQQVGIVNPLVTCAPGAPTNCTFAPSGNTGGNEVVIANAGWNFCTGTNMSLPTPASGGLFDPATDTGVSIDGPEPADQNNGWMHYYTSSTAGVSVSWVMSCGTTQEDWWAGRVAAFKSATSGGPVVPTVTTTTATNITLADALSGGTVTSNGGATVTSEGVCYGLSINPTTPCIPPDGGGTATPFTSTIIQLLSNKLYHYRSFATNSAGTGFGPDQTFTTTGGPLAISVGGVQGLEPRPNQIGPNLLLNGNWNTAASWTLTACGLFDSTTTHTADGSGSLKILNCGATQNTSQVVGWTQYTGKYQFSFWTQTDSAAGGELNIAASILNVGSLSGSGGCQTAENSYTVIPAAGASGAVPRLPTLPGQSWVQNFFQCYYNPFQFQEAAAAGAAMKTRLSITSTSQIGTVWVDDISFNEVWYPLHSFLTYPNFHGYLWNDKVPRIPQQPGSPWPYAAPVTGEIMGVGEIIPSSGNTLASGTLTVKMSTVAGCASGVLSTKTFNSASTPVLSATTYWHFLPSDYGTLTIGNGYYICSSYTDPGGTFPVPDWLIYYENSTFRNTLENWIDVDQEFVHNGVRSWWIGASDRTTATYTTNLTQMNVQSTCTGGPPSSNTSGAACIEQQWQGPCSGTVNMGNPVTTCTGNVVSPLATGSSLPANFTGGPTRSADIAALHYTEMFAPIGLYSNCNPGWSAITGYYTIASDTCTPYLQVGQDFGFVSNFISQLYYGSVVTETDTDTGPSFNPTVTVGAGSISGNFLAVQLSVAEASLPDTQSNGTFDQYPETPPSAPIFANLAGGPAGVTVQTPACPYPSTRYFGYYIYAGVTPTAALPAASSGTLSANGTNVVTWQSGATFPASGINYITITIAGVPKNFTIQSFDSSTQLHLWTTVTTGSGLTFTFQGATQRQPIQAATFATSQPVGNAPIPCGTTVNIASLVNTSVNPVTVDMGNKRELNVFWMPSTMTDAQSLGFRAQTLQSTTLASGMGMNYIHDEALPTSAGNVFYQLQRGMRAYGHLNFGYLADDKSDFWQWRALDDVVSNDPFPTMGGSTFFEENAIYAPIGWPTHPGFSCQTYQSSTVSVNGTSTITWVSGGQFNPAWTGTVLINNVVYTIVPPVTATSMTLTTTVPSGPNTTFTFPNNIGPVLCFPAGVDVWAHELGRYDYGSRPSSVFVTEEPFGTLAGVSYQEVRRIELKGITGIQEWGVTGVNMSRWVFGNAGFEQMVWNGNYQSFADHLAWGNFLSSIAPILIQPVTDSSILGFHNMVTNETASTTAAADCGATSGYTISSHFPFGQIRTVVHKDSASPQVIILANNLCYGTPSVTFTGNFGGATTVTAQGDATAPGTSYTIPISGGSFTDSFTPMEQKVYILSVAVTPPIALVNPSSLSYASQLVGTTSTSQPVTIQNTGGSNLIFNTAFATVTGNFAIASGTTCVSNGTLAPGASCTINVTFSPLSVGTLSGVLTISDNSGGSSSTQTVPLQGTGTLSLIQPLTGTGSVTGNGSVVVHP